MTGQPFSPLVAEILTAQVAMTQDVANGLIESLQAQLAEADARRVAVEHGVLGLISGKYMATPAAIEQALFPQQHVIDRFREGES